MRRDSPSSRALVGQDQKGADHRRRPARSLAHDPGQEALLHVETPVGLLDRREIAFDFEDRDRPGPFLSRQDVDRTAFAEVREGHFRLNLPAERPQDLNHHLDDERMPPVEQPVDSPSAPEQVDVEPGVKGSGRTAKNFHSLGANMTALDLGDRLLADPSPLRQFDLTPPVSAPERTDDQPKATIVHPVKDGNARLSATYLTRFARISHTSGTATDRRRGARAARASSKESDPWPR